MTHAQRYNSRMDKIFDAAKRANEANKPEGTTDMDPNQTWRDLCDALAADFHTLALDHAGNLLEWIRKGGFNPINCSHEGAQALLRTIIAELEE